MFRRYDWRVIDDKDEVKIFDFKGIQPEFEKLLMTVSNLLEREFPPKFAQYDSAQVIFMLRFRITMNTFHAILFLCADTPREPERLPSFALAVPPMVRTLFEELITIIFLLHDTPGYIDYIYKTEYNEKKRERDFAKKYHEGSPLWDKYIADIEQILKEMEARYGMTEKDFKKYGKYPTAGEMIARLKKDFPDSDVLPFLEFIKTWIYRQLSSQTHLDIKGFQNKGVHFSKKMAKQMLGKDYKKTLEHHLKEYEAVQIFNTMTLLMSLMTEINRAFGFKLEKRLIYVWEIFAEFSDITKDFYNERYSALLK